MNDTLDRDVLQYTLNWASTNGYSVSGSQILIELLPISREHSNIEERERALHAAAQQLVSGQAELATSSR
ncbi:hypothetical protein DFJ75_2497 [Williamsia muralis]|uniref:Uncharacterized protein n=1 Tax=Williamsia marianensis TaxID=85044 RepID=A0A495K3B2_WILMA|nr:hypothetical protein [Williamsia muralis]MDV7135657.1 hypothetical protein [Williamsia muralis]RKR95671.1 hypothetical protein DFJ75_2497 [Williamsia muralis]